MSHNVKNVIDELNALTESIGLSKLADVIADPGTAQPAEQEKERSQIQPATTGAQAAENSAAVKEQSQVHGQSVDAAKPSQAENGPLAASSTEKLTTATTVGDDPSVEKNYGSAKEQGNYPGTTQPADINKETEKYSAEQATKDADGILAEVNKIKKASCEDLTMDNAIEKLAELLSASEAGEKTAAEKTAAAENAISEFLTGYVKSAALLGELTADALDGIALGAQLQKQAEEEEEAEEAGEEAGAEAGAMEGAAAGPEDAAADQILQEAIALAQELGVEPEDVLEAALSEAPEMGGGEEAGAEVIPAEEIEALAGGAPVSEEELMALQGAPMEVMASVKKLAKAKDKQITELKEKVAQFEAEKAALANDEKLATTINRAMDGWWAKKSAELSSNK